MLKNQKGVTILEMIIAGAMFAGIGYVATSVYTNAVENAVLSQNSKVVSGVRRQLNKLATKVLHSMSIPRLDPQRTLVGPSEVLIAGNPPATSTNSPAMVAAADPKHDTSTSQPLSWNLADGVEIVRGTVPDFDLAGTQGKSTSFTIENFHLNRKNNDPLKASELEGITRSIFYSRCIDRELPKELEDYTIAEIIDLRVPYFLRVKETSASTETEPGIFCCPRTDILNQSCPDPNDNELNDPNHRLRFWPTVFILQPDGGIATIPTKSERPIVFGAAMQLSVDGNPPTQMTMEMVVMYNKCKVSRVGFGGRAPHKCVEPILGVLRYENFNTDIHFTYNRKTKDVSRDVTGSSFIRMGTKTVH